MSDKHKKERRLCFANPSAAFKDGGYIGEIETYSSKDDMTNRSVLVRISMGSHSTDDLEALADYLNAKTWHPAA